MDTTDPHGAKGRVRNNNAYLLVYDRISTNLNSEGSAGETSILKNQRTTSIRDNEVLASANKIAEDELPDSAADIMQKRRSKLPQRRSRSDGLSYLDHSSHLDSHLPDSLQQMHPRVQYAVWLISCFSLMIGMSSLVTFSFQLEPSGACRMLPPLC